MTRAAWGLVAAAVVLGLVFCIGRWTAPHDDQAVSAELLAARIRADSIKLAHVADSIQLARSREATDLANAAAARQEKRSAALAKVSKAYRDSVEILNDSLAILHSSAGETDTLPVPPMVIDRLRADSATIAEQGFTIDTLKIARDRAKDERADALKNEQTARDAFAHYLKKQLPLEREASYNAGKRVGRKQGIVLGAIGGVAVVFAGVKVVDAFHPQVNSQQPGIQQWLAHREP